MPPAKQERPNWQAFNWNDALSGLEHPEYLMPEHLPILASMMRPLVNTQTGKLKPEIWDILERESGIAEVNAFSQGESLWELYNREIPGQFWLIEQVIPAVGATLMSAAPKVGKSTLILSWLAAMADGGVWAGRDVKEGIAWFCTEEGERTIKRRMLTVGPHQPNRHRIFYSRAFGEADWEANMLALIAQVEEVPAEQKPGIVIFDTFSDFGVTSDFNAYEKMTAPVNLANRTAQRLEIAILLVHHNRKGLFSSDSALGSTAIPAKVDQIITIPKPPIGEKTSVRKLFIEGRDFDSENLLTVRLGEPDERGRRRYLSVRSNEPDGKFAKLFEALADGGKSSKELEGWLGINRRNTNKLVAEAVAQGLVETESVDNIPVHRIKPVNLLDG